MPMVLHFPVAMCVNNYFIRGLLWDSMHYINDTSIPGSMIDCKTVDVFHVVAIMIFIKIKVHDTWEKLFAMCIMFPEQCSECSCPSPLTN